MSQVAKAEDYLEATKEAGLVISMKVFLSLIEALTLPFDFAHRILILPGQFRSIRSKRALKLLVLQLNQLDYLFKNTP